MKAEKTRCGNTMTEAGFRTWITSHLRTLTRKWAPKNKCLRDAKEKARKRIESDAEKYADYLTKKGTAKRGYFVCECCDTIQNIEKGKNIAADHIEPIIDPAVGFAGWDSWLERGLCEADGFQCLCKKCHDIKTETENKIRRESK